MNRTLSIEIRQFFWPLFFGSASLLAHPAIAQTTGALRFLCSGEAENATVFINEKNMGQCPFDIEIPSGRQAIAVSKPSKKRGFERRFETQFELSPGAARRVEVKLGDERPTKEAEVVLVDARNFYRESVEYSRKLTSPLDMEEYIGSALSPDGRYFAIARKTKSKKDQAGIEIWDIEGKRLVGNKEIVDITFVENPNDNVSKPTSEIYGIKFSPDSAQVLFFSRTALERPVYQRGSSTGKWLYSDEVWKFEIASATFSKAGGRSSATGNIVATLFSSDANLALLQAWSGDWVLWNVREGRLLREIPASDRLFRNHQSLRVLYLSNTGDVYARSDGQRQILNLKFSAPNFSQIDMDEHVSALWPLEHKGRLYFVGKNTNSQNTATGEHGYQYLIEAESGRVLEKHRLSNLDKLFFNFSDDFSFAKSRLGGNPPNFEIYGLNLQNDVPSFKPSGQICNGVAYFALELELYQYALENTILHLINDSLFCTNKVITYIGKDQKTGKVHNQRELALDPYLLDEESELFSYAINSIEKPRVISFKRNIYSYSQTLGRRGALKSTSIEVWGLGETNYGSIERVK